MLRGCRALPLRRIALWGFSLNMAWEFAQCTVIYDMWDWGCSALIPTVRVVGRTVGLSPIVQVTVLPAPAVWGAWKQA